MDKDQLSQVIIKLIEITKDFHNYCDVTHVCDEVYKVRLIKRNGKIILTLYKNDKIIDVQDY